MRPSQRLCAGRKAAHGLPAFAKPLQQRPGAPARDADGPSTRLPPPRSHTDVVAPLPTAPPRTVKFAVPSQGLTNAPMLRGGDASAETRRAAAAAAPAPAAPAVVQRLEEQQQEQQQQQSQPGQEQQEQPAAAVAQPAAPAAASVLLPPPARLAPVPRNGGMRVAAAVSRHLSAGRPVTLPAGSGTQVSRALGALAAARILMLCKGGGAAGLVFQPNFVGSSSSSSGGGGGGGDRDASNIRLLVTGVAEAQLRRFERSPLIAARHGDPRRLGGAALARVCQQGFTTLRAAGPDAARVALAAVAAARRRLRRRGLDLAVVPATELVDVESLAAAAGGNWGAQGDDAHGDAPPLPAFDDDGSEVGPRRCVKVTLLHVVRCEPDQPWRLLPSPAPPLPQAVEAQLQQAPVGGAAAGAPAAQQQHQQQQLQQQRPRLQQLGNDAAAASRSDGGRARRQQQHHQQQQQPPPLVPSAPGAGGLGATAAAAAITRRKLVAVPGASAYRQ